MKFLAFLYRNLLSLRYNVKLIGIDNIEHNKPTLFLPNHQAIVDPQILFSHLIKHFEVVPIVTETYFKIPIIKTVLKKINAVPVSDLSKPGNRNVDVLENIKKNVNKTFSENKCILLYPSGQITKNGKEEIINKKSAWEIVQNLDTNVQIVIVIISGLWGSMWSSYKTQKTPKFFSTFIKGIIIVLINFVFFSPKRNVTIEFLNITNIAVELSKKNKKDFNTFLETKYNNIANCEPICCKYFFLK